MQHTKSQVNILTILTSLVSRLLTHTRMVTGACIDVSLYYSCPSNLKCYPSRASNRQIETTRCIRP